MQRPDPASPPLPRGATASPPPERPPTHSSFREFEYPVGLVSGGPPCTEHSRLANFRDPQIRLVCVRR